MKFRYVSRFRGGLPPGAARFGGMPKFNFTGGHNDPHMIPVDALAAAASSVIKRHGSLLAIYNLGQGPLGYLGLREFLASKLTGTRGMSVTADDILITSGSLQGIDFVNEILLEPGDTILAEEFTYSSVLTRAKKRGISVVPVPVDGDGLRIDQLEAILSDLKAKGVKPKYLYTIPTIQNPTGSILPLERRLSLIQLAKTHEVPIFEDECYADIVWADDAPPALYAIDPTQVIHIGSLSKSLAPALRLGYLVAGWEVLSQIIALKTDGGTGAIDQMVAAEYFSTHFDTHIRKLKSGLLRKLETLVKAVDREFGTDAELTVPKGGIFAWLKFPEGVKVSSLTAPSAESGIAFNPGPEWACAAGSADNMLRLCFALTTEAEIEEGMRELARVCFETTGFPRRGDNRARIERKPDK
ncbi:aminotransferase [Bradyrhizobium sp. LTSP885]|nr:aminotransferase [Bradyrhizobium sp. LTSP885]